MTALPASLAVTLPSWSTVATAVLLDLQLTDLSVASLGLTVAVKISLFPFSRVSSVLFRDTEPTGITTVTLQVAVLAPSFVVTVMTALPASLAVTLPSWSTVATAVLLDLQLTDLSVASLGLTVAVRVSLLPFSRVSSVLFKETEVTGISTVTEQSAVCSPAVAEIVAAPADTPFTTPSWLTYATAASELFHMTVLSVALAGVTVAESCLVWPTLTVIDVILRLIPVTGITLALTVT